MVWLYIPPLIMFYNWVSGSFIGGKNLKRCHSSHFLLTASGWRQEGVNGRKWQTLIRLNEKQQVQVLVPQRALIQPLQAGSRLWLELRGGREFYLKSGKPQEVTLRRSCHCIAANRQTIHQDAHVGSRSSSKESHKPGWFYMKDRAWWVIHIPRILMHNRTNMHDYSSCFEL